MVKLKRTDWRWRQESETQECRDQGTKPGEVGEGAAWRFIPGHLRSQWQGLDSTPPQYDYGEVTVTHHETASFNLFLKVFWRCGANLVAEMKNEPLFLSVNCMPVWGASAGPKNLFLRWRMHKKGWRFFFFPQGKKKVCSTEASWICVYASWIFMMDKC